MGKQLYKTKDLYNGDKWYDNTISTMRKHAQDYVDSCEGDCILQYRILDIRTGKYRLLTESEIKEENLPI